ncbi:hypothetical protein [Azospirillum sp. sgz302134]
MSRNEPEAFTLARYAAILRAGLDAGYRFAGFDELAQVRGLSTPACLLRHDCDNDLVAALRMARVEAEAGVHSTWFVMPRSALYNLFSPPNAAIVREILALGHRLALHFDELPFRDATPEVLAAQVERERCWLAEEFGHPVCAVSFHQPSRRVLDNAIILACLNTYDRKDMDGFHYLSDSNMNWREGCPGDLFRERRHPKLQLLVHPEWWTDGQMSQADKWRAMLADNFGLMQRSLLEREATYNVAQDIVFLPIDSGGHGAKGKTEPSS